MLSQDVGTPLYTAPELEKGLEYDEKIDMFSLGLTFYEIIRKFETDHERYIHMNGLRR